MKIQGRRLIELLQAKYREDPEGFREFLPGVVDLLPEQPPEGGSRRSVYGLTEQEIAFHHAELAEVFGKLDKGSAATDEAIRGLQHCAALILDDSLPEEAGYEKLKSLIRVALGKSPGSYKSKATVQVIEGNADIHKRVSAIRGVYLNLDRSRRLVSISINPRKVRERRELMKFVGASRDRRPDVSSRHDDYPVPGDPHGTR